MKVGVVILHRCTQAGPLTFQTSILEVSRENSFKVVIKKILGKPGQCFQLPPALAHATSTAPSVRPPTSHAVSTDDVTHAVHDHLKIQLLIRSYQTRGHNIADLDPLGINSADLDDTIPRELELDFYGFTDKDLDREFILPPTTFIGGDRATLTLREILDRLKVNLKMNLIA